MWFILIFLLNYWNECAAVSGGDVANYSQYNYIVSVQNSSGDHFFAGVIISNYHVLTTCADLAEINEHEVVPYPNLVKMRIAAGMSPKAPEAIRYPEMAFIHPSCKWGPDIIQYDLGIMKTFEPWDFSTGNIGVARLPRENWVKLDERITAMVENGAVCNALGWGTVGEATSDTLLVAKLKLSTWRECQKQYCRECYNFEAANICTAPKNQHSICDGDQGGPLVCEGEVWGIIGYPHSVCGKPHYHNYARTGTRTSKSWIGGISGNFGQFKMAGSNPIYMNNILLFAQCLVFIFHYLLN
ncbi:snake venom serine protease catroxase-2-like [Cimex lectularius]|uniref:Peptidase S1 domain-containing protein n=1 Tax=Cimex lectularius TaxID=79782 RepID=A0A8I6RLQ0_CIMLE|nr:snake venom serine protease catroxase-2-like [Cimex lectularius]